MHAVDRTTQQRKWWLTLRISMGVIIFFCCFFVYNLNVSAELSGDTRASELLPVILLKYHTWDFAPVLHTPLREAYWFRQAPQSGKIVSAYPIVPGLMAMPVYATAAAFGVDIEQHVPLLSKIAASSIAALAVVVFFFLCREFFAVATAWLITFLFAFGTHLWTVASRGLWQHGPGILFINLTLLALIKARQHPRLYYVAGICAGMAVWSRPANGLFFVPLGVYLLLHEKFSSLIKTCMGGVLPMALLATYSQLILGSVKRLGQFQEVNFSYPFVQGLAGLLFSPSHGLFIFAPIFLFSVVAGVYVWRDAAADPLLKYLTLSAVLLIGLYAKWFMWWGGWSYGYRLLMETLPAFLLLLGYAWERWISKKAIAKIIFIAFAYQTVVFEIIGAFFWPCNYTVIPDYRDAASRARLWEISANVVSTCVNEASLKNPAKNMFVQSGTK